MVPDFQQWKPQWDFVVQGKYTMEGGKRDQTSKNLGEMHHGAITLTDRHPFLISMQIFFFFFKSVGLWGE